jgi:hypothetical protein
LLAFADDVMRLRESASNRTGMIRAFASALGSLGRPTFLGFALLKASELLYDCRSHGIAGRLDRMRMQDSDMTARMLWIVRIVRPGVQPSRSRMIDQVKDLHYSFPYGLATERFFDRDAFNVHGFDSM